MSPSSLSFCVRRCSQLSNKTSSNNFSIRQKHRQWEYNETNLLSSDFLNPLALPRADNTRDRANYFEDLLYARQIQSYSCLKLRHRAGIPNSREFYAYVKLQTVSVSGITDFPGINAFSSSCVFFSFSLSLLYEPNLQEIKLGINLAPYSKERLRENVHLAIKNIHAQYIVKCK